MSTKTITGELQPNVPQLLDLSWPEGQMWSAYDFHGIHIGRVTLKTSAQYALRRLSHGTVWVSIRAYDQNDNEILFTKNPINLQAIVRNDMIHPFLDADEVVRLPIGPDYAFRKADHWTIEFSVEDVETLADEELTLMVTALAQ
ncbi:MAG TPA: hypothetical protein PL070_07095 [Flavobacteriales bacterium]|nr:hypothetical protein [Flavobacteriales bacterium]